jgi:hypothetical protein
MLNMEHRDHTRNSCKEYNKKTFDVIKKKYSKIPVIIIARLNLYPLGFNEQHEVEKPYMYFNEDKFNPSYKTEFTNRFVKNMCDLSESNPVYILKPVPEFGFNIPRKMVKNEFLGLPREKIEMSVSSYDERNEFISSVLKRTETTCNIHLIDVNHNFLSKGSYVGNIKNIPLYKDDNHLNVFGVNLISKDFDFIWTL